MTVPPTSTVPTPTDLTLRQLEVAGAIQSFTDHHGYPPTLREIGELVGLASPSSVLHHVRLLEHGGVVVRERGRARTVAVIEEPSAVGAVLGRAGAAASTPASIHQGMKL